MKNHIPTFLVLSIFIGLLTYIVISNSLLNDLIIFHPDFEENRQQTQLVLKRDSTKHVLSVSELAIKGIEVSNTNLDHTNIKNQLYVNTHPAALTWILFHSIVLSLATASILFLIFLIYRIKKQFNIIVFSKKSFKTLIPILLLITLTVLSLMFFAKDHQRIMGGAKLMTLFDIIFYNPKTIVNSILTVYFAVGVVPLIGILFINIAIRNAFNFNTTKQKENWQINYKRLKDKLNVFALFIGLLVGSSIISTRLQRDMIAEQIYNIKEIFPDEFIYGYGISFTLILALFFLPSLGYLKYYKQKEGTYSQVKKSPTSWWKLGEESIDDIKLIFSIIIPLLSSIVQSFFS
ncbi:hypothetical protein [Aquimarina sp. 2201CG5-10]|uniref:hypothetical protein n=1 Tax=Aquimarina callyspongiae TaxID=3098150 RepID=UPI002AB52396|nr:hypothetical protein [Aquimarina sp. 2201CG5-10]MDY8136237.1 hypothetical protein [Aquimarina sp. 2201CG5-10]